MATTLETWLPDGVMDGYAKDVSQVLIIKQVDPGS